jgi:hypothetical protein
MKTGSGRGLRQPALVSDGAASHLHPSGFDPARCCGCGHFLSYDEMAEGGGAHCDFTPLNEFGPEVIDWTCRRCVEKERMQ